jgi:sugar phosphate isomerase/epimerase
VTNWRTTAPLDYFVSIRKKFNGAGIDLYGYTPSVLAPDSSDEVLKRTCEVSKALGVKVIVNAMPRSVAKRFVPFVEKYDLKVAFQGHPDANSRDPDAISTPADYQEALTYSKKFGILLDIGDATAGGFDVLKFVRENHHRIYILNLKDRRKKDRTSMPWGERDTPVKDSLLLVRDNKYPIRCYVDCDYETMPETTRVADSKRCLAYCKEVLTSQVTV